MKPTYLLIRFVKIATLLLFMVALFYAYYYLPRRVAVSFNAFGRPEDYLEKDHFFYGLGLFVIFFNVVVSVLGRLVPALPNTLLGVPNRLFWVGTREHRDALNLLVRNWLNALTIFVNLFLMASLFILVRVHTGQQIDIWEYGWVFLLALLVLVGWLVFLPVRLMVRKIAVAS